MRVLISGAGIAGPCLAYWLRRHGHEPTIVERAPALRTGGYVVDFWGAGYDVAERMGILPAVLQHGYQVRELMQVDRRGRRVSGLPIRVFDEVTHGRFTSVARSDLARCIHDALQGEVETIFGDSITALDDRGDAIEVSFERGARRSFDLVVGADGLHSQVRRLVFGAEEQFERYLGLKVAAFQTRGYRPRDELVYAIHSEIGQQIGRFAMRDDVTMFLFVFADESPALPADLAAQKTLLREKFAGSGWECAAILDALDAADDLYLDRASQVRMPRWTQGRVALVGDAAFCVSLLGGQGSALAMIAAYALAGELHRAAGDHVGAFARYEEKLRAFLAMKQDAAIRFAPFFAPRSRVGMFVNRQVMKLMSLPFVTRLAVGRELADRIDLSEYAISG